MRCCALLAVLAFSLHAPQHARADAAAADVLLWSHDIQWAGGLAEVASSLSPRIEIRDPNAPSPGALVTIFAWLDVDAGDSGMVFSAGPATDADWPYFTHYLTDGAPHQLRFVLRFPSGSATGGQIPGPELPGLIITRADMRLGDVSLISPGRNPNGDGRWTDYTFNARLEIHGTGPTSATATSWGRLKRLYR